MPSGLIVKALSGYYYVLSDSKLIQCRARGIFKKREISPLVGDRVEFEQTENDEGVITAIQQRTNQLARPPIANVTQAVLIFSLSEPVLNLQLLDKFLVHIEKAGLQSVICFSKTDLVEAGRSDGSPGNSKLIEDEQSAELIYELYESIGYQVLATSARRRLGLEQVKEVLTNQISVLCGQSGVGKSTLLNAILPHLELQTGEISLRLGRGKHTTRHVELISIEDEGWVADTPGFSQLDFTDMEPEDLSACFIEFRPLADSCRFRGCIHMEEPGCHVQEAVRQGRISNSRYQHYRLFLQEIKEKKRRY